MAEKSVEVGEEKTSFDSIHGQMCALSPEQASKVWRKLDTWIVPMVTMLYLLSFMDRVNLGNARVAGLQADLGLSNHQYSVAVSITFIPYILSELPSNLLLKIVGPNVLLPVMVTLWGLVTALQGLVHNYAGLIACRFFLGLLEGGLMPGVILYLSFFYPRARLQSRIASFFASASLAGAFSGLLAYGIINMDGVAGRRGWAWIFILEGAFTSAFGLIVWKFIPPTPRDAKFLTEKEQQYIVDVLKEDGAVAKDDNEDKFNWPEVWKAFAAPHVWWFTILAFFDGTMLFSIAYFTPSIVQSLGYTNSRAQLMSVPPFVVAFFTSIAAAFVSDRWQCRGAISLVSSVLRIAGFALFLTASDPHVRYGALFISIPGSYLGPPTILTWTANNFAPHTRRAVAIAVSCIGSNSGGILATWLLGALSKPPRYKRGTWVLLGFSIGMLVVSLILIFYLSDQNKRKERAKRDGNKDDERPGLGDRSMWFKYTL